MPDTGTSKLAGTTYLDPLQGEARESVDPFRG